MDLHLSRFAPDVEREFQANYYERVRPTLRLVSGILAIAIAFYGLIGTRQSNPFVDIFDAPQLLFCLALFGLTYLPAFGRVWQSATVVMGWVSSLLSLFWLASIVSQVPPVGHDNTLSGIIVHLFFLLQVVVLMVVMAAFRLQFFPALALQSVIILGALCTIFFILPPDFSLLNSAIHFLEPALLVLLAVLLASYTQERLARSAFEANRELAKLQAQEYEKRVATENMLHVLNGAIGGIVHDLGNPLTSVQNGSEILEQVLKEDTIDPEMARELNGIVIRGARLLSFLRLSLIEQARALEGKPIPVDLKPVSVRAIIEAGSSFQKPRFAQGHTLNVEGEDLSICADEMKMVTVMMNLIGNALKYSDGEVRVTWKRQDELLVLGVLDMGKNGQGITRSQAERLFTAFGRLDTHANIEGTGLGLLSVRKIAEAHTGEACIEGFEAGRPDSPTFSTARDDSLSLLCAPFRTAFVVSCPLAA